MPLALLKGIQFYCRCCCSGGRTVRVVVTAPALGRRRTASCLRTALFLFVVTFVWLQLHMSSLSSSPRQELTSDNDSSQAILSMVPQVLNSPGVNCALSTASTQLLLHPILMYAYRYIQYHNSGFASSTYVMLRMGNKPYLNV